MGCSSSHLFLLLLLLLIITLSSSSFLHTHARDSQFFNKASDDQPKFLPENDNGYGLYPHGSSQLPNNYNPVAYVTLPELDTNSNPNSYFNKPQPQGMSDTRFLESGKYFYDLNTHKYSTNHPYQVLPQDHPTTNQFHNRNFYANTENAYEFNGEGYQTQDEFEDELTNLP